MALKLTETSAEKVIAFHDQCTRMVRGWSGLWEWRDELAVELTTTVRSILGKEIERVPLSTWTQILNPGPVASALEYHRLLQLQHPWLFDIDPRIDNLDWLIAEEN